MKIVLDNVGLNLNPNCPLFEKVSLELGAHSIINLYTEESIGKSSLLKILYLDLEPDQGSVIYDDQYEFPGLKPSKISYLKKEIGYIPKDLVFFPNRSVVNNLEIVMSYFNRNQKKVKKELDQLLFNFKLITVKNSLPESLSIAEKRRLQFARSMALQPSIILADDPFSSIDHENYQFLAHSIDESFNRGISWIITSNGRLNFNSDIQYFKLTSTGLENK